MVKAGKKQTVSGLIIKDDLSGIVLEKSGATVPVARADVSKFLYGNMPKQLNDAKEAIDNESWAEAQDFLRAVGPQLKKIDPKQRSLILQYAYYYRAKVLHNTGDYASAIKAYGSVLSSVKNSKFYFDAKLGEAQVLEDSGKFVEAKNRYSLLQSDFMKKITDLKLSKKSVAKYHLLAKLGEMRMIVWKLNEDNPKNKKAKLDELDTELGATMRKYPKTEEGAEAANLVKSLIWKGQEKWDKLVTFLDKVIIEGQLADKRKKLMALYKARADANLAKKDYRAAVLDFMRLWLEYNVDGASAAEVHYRIGECFINIKDEDWMKNAKRHLGISKSKNSGGFSVKAGELSKEISNLGDSKKKSAKK
jgi:tetratricopeptide (TPR) repeat protein